jgi:hypothetical protein
VQRSPAAKNNLKEEVDPRDVNSDEYDDEEEESEQEEVEEGGESEQEE